jgi:hypothetical protein
MSANFATLHTGSHMRFDEFRYYTWHLHSLECLAPGLFHHLYYAAQEKTPLFCSKQVGNYLVYAKILREDGTVKSKVTELLRSRQIFQQLSPAQRTPPPSPASPLVRPLKKPIKSFFPTPSVSTPSSCASTSQPPSSSVSSTSSLPLQAVPEVVLRPCLINRRKPVDLYDLLQRIDRPGSQSFRDAQSKGYLSSLMPKPSISRASHYNSVIGHTLAEAIAQKAFDKKNLLLMRAVLPYLTKEQIFFRIEVNSPEGFMKTLERFTENPAARELLLSHPKAKIFLSQLAEAHS